MADDMQTNTGEPIDASQLGGGDSPGSGGEDLPGAEGTAAMDNEVTIPDPTGEEVANTYPIEP